MRRLFLNRPDLYRSGITLIELIAVMAIMSMLAIFAVPSVYSLLTSHGLSSAIRDVSNHLVNARAEAIAKHTLTRFMVATTWTEEDGAFRKFSTWRWNNGSSEFDRIGKWITLPKGIVFEPRFPNYILKSDYAKNDATSVHGEYALSQEDAAIEVMAMEGEFAQVQFVEFLPTGASRIPGGTLNNVIFVLVEGDMHQSPSGPTIARRSEHPNSPDNWAQINLGTLTGRVRIYRP